MGRVFFKASDFVLALFLCFIGLGIFIPHFVAGICLILLGITVFALSSKAASRDARLYLPRVGLYSALFVYVAGFSIADLLHTGASGAKGDWYFMIVCGMFFFSNALAYAFWARS